jgi:Na+/H+ antiporter NhaD/arsenite permease-like protein
VAIICELASTLVQYCRARDSISRDARDQEMVIFEVLVSGKVTWGFIVVGGLEKNLLTPKLIGAIDRLHLEGVPLLTVVTALLSNLVSNVPAVLVLKPLVESLRNQQHAWLTIAMASTLAGNFTLIGSVANLIVVQSASARGVTLHFWEYFKVGAPLTVMTVAVGILRL